MEILLQIILSIGIMQGILFILHQVFIKKINNKALKYLILFVTFLSLNNIQVLVLINDIFKEHFLFKNIEFSFPLFILPYFLAFIIEYFKIESKKNKFIVIAYAIFIIQVVIRFCILYLTINQQLDVETIFYYTKIEELINLLFSLWVFVKIVKYVFNPKYSQNIIAFDDTKWLQSIVVLGIAIICLWIYAVSLNFLEHGTEKYMYNPLRIGSTILLYWIAYMGLVKINLTDEKIAYFETKNVDKISTPKKSKEDTELIFRNIDSYIETNERFTDTNFTLERLAIEMKLSRSSLSRIINERFNSFSDYINQKRVAKAKEVLLSDEFKNYKLDIVAYECGFNSKSNFYLVFKKYCNETPTDWQQNNK